MSDLNSLWSEVEQTPEKKTANIDWGLVEGAQEPVTEETSAWEKLESDPLGYLKNAAKSLAWNFDTGEISGAAKTAAETVGQGTRMVRSIAAGAYTAPVRLAETAVGMGEDIAGGIKNIYARTTGAKPEPAYRGLSEWLGESAETAESIIQPKEMRSSERIAKRAGEYAGFTGMFTSRMVAAGQQLLARPPTNPTAIEAMLMDAAKNPKATQKLDQTISAVMATAGGGAEEYLDATPETQLVIELLAGMSTGKGIQLTKKIGDNLKRLTSAGSKTLGDKSAGQYISDIAAEQPGFEKSLERGEKLSKKYGVEMDVPEMADSRELKAAKQVLAEEKAGGKTAEDVRQARQEAQARTAFRGDEPVIERGRQVAKEGVEARTSELKAQGAKAEELARMEADPYKNLDTTEKGRSILYTIDDAEAKADLRVRRAYESVGWDVPVGNETVVQGINKAKRSRLPGNEWKGELNSHLSKIFNKLQGKTDVEKTYGTKKPFQLGRGEAKLPELSVGAVHELQGQIKQSIREARALGKDSLVRSLSIVLESTYKQLDNATGVSRESVKTLKNANDLARKNFERFDNARINILTRVDKQGVYKTSPEDIYKNVVRSNSQANAETSVQAVMDAVGYNNVARKLLKDAFMSKMAVAAVNEGRLNPKAVDNFIKRHSKFLKAAGLEKLFKDPAKYSKAYDDAMLNIDKEISDIGRMELSKWINSDDPVAYVMSSIKSGRIKALVRDAKNPLVRRSIKEAAWDGILKKTGAKQGLVGHEKGLNPEYLRDMMQNNRRELINALGKDHFKSAQDLLKIIDSVTPNATKTAGFVMEKGQPALVEKLLTGLRAAAHGFVRPDLIAAQAVKRTWEAKALKESKKAVQEALINKQYAEELIQLYRRSPEGKAVVTMTLSPYANAFYQEQTSTQNNEE